MDKFNAGLVYMVDMPDSVKAEIRAAKHVQWHDGHAWNDFKSAKQRSHCLTDLTHLPFRVEPGTEHLLMGVRKPKPKKYITLNITPGEAKVLRRLLKELG